MKNVESAFILQIEIDVGNGEKQIDQFFPIDPVTGRAKELH